jgi:hypothetical protein
MIVNDICRCQMMIADGSCGKSSRPWVPLRPDARSCSKHELVQTPIFKDNKM